MSVNQKDDRVAISTLISQLGNDDGVIREKARLKLVGIGEPAVAPLIQALTDRNKETRWEAAKALGEIASPKAVPALVKSMEDEDHDVRWLAAEAMIAIGTEAVIPILEAIIARSHEHLLLQGAHHVFHHLSGADAGITHHLTKHPRVVDPAIRVILKPVVTALEGVSSMTEAPGAARRALEAARKLSKKR